MAPLSFESVPVRGKSLAINRGGGGVFEEGGDGDGSSSMKFSGVEEEKEETNRKVIVDMRELRSSLPFVLYKSGFLLEPLTIDIGDYILCKGLCIERKSTSDLISSLNNGRLYAQVEQLTRNYELSLLLIEFDENKPFSLLPFGDFRSEISISDISSKLCLLLLHFPTLKLVWSPSLAATADIFHDLKRGQSEPDILTEGQASDNNNNNSSSSNSMGGGGGGDPVARDILLSMPGITKKNSYIIMRYVKNIKELCKVPLAKLESLLGAQDAQKLYSFLNEPI